MDRQGVSIIFWAIMLSQVENYEDSEADVVNGVGDFVILFLLVGMVSVSGDGYGRSR